MSQLSFDVIKRVWPKSGLVTIFKKYSRSIAVPIFTVKVTNSNPMSPRALTGEVL